MNYKELVANSNIAFSGGNFTKALEYARSAVAIDDKGVEAYSCAGKACMSLDMYKEAAEYYEKAVAYDKNNGNLYFLLGYAQVLADDTTSALRSLTRSLENNCDDALRGQIYKMIAMINRETGDYKNALINLDQAERFLDLDYELLQQRAACYAGLKDYHQTIYTLNQMKLLQPSDYQAYSLAFNILMEIGAFSEAKEELDRAQKYADLVMTYYYDMISYTMFHDVTDETDMEERWNETLRIIDDGLKNGYPTAEQVFEMYLRAAQLYLTLQNPSMAIKVLDAAVNPVSSFNNGFSVLPEDAPVEKASEAFDELSPEDEDAIMQEKWDSGELDDIREDIQNALYDSVSEDPEELADEIHAYLTPEDAIPAVEKEAEVYLLTGDFQMEQAQADMRNSMYIAAYEMLKDYDGMLRKARELQASSIGANRHSGIYYELKVGKYLGKENWEKKYKERINFWTKRMLEDPTDFISASYRIRSYMDIGDFENAEQLCACLPTDVKGPLMDEIQKAKAHGGGEDGGTH